MFEQSERVVPEDFLRIGIPKPLIDQCEWLKDPRLSITKKDLGFFCTAPSPVELFEKLSSYTLYELSLVMKLGISVDLVSEAKARLPGNIVAEKVTLPFGTDIFKHLGNQNWRMGAARDNGFKIWIKHFFDVDLGADFKTEYGNPSPSPR